MVKPVSSKIDFPALERKWLKHWYEKGIVDKYLKKNEKSKKYFSFLDGPITANNPMGVHHAWGRTYKDLWQKFYNLLGYKQRFHNGFDCQGLWVEVEVEKELGVKNKKEIENLIPGDKTASIAKFVQLCKERVYKYSKIQTEQSKRLGYFMDWENSYYTMSDENNYMIWHFLKVCHENGWLYKGYDVVPWCPRCQTAISQHEILTEDYKEITHETVFFKLPVKEKDFSLVAWTTTPWTIPGNVALAVNPKFTYALYQNKKTGEKVVILDPKEVKEDEEAKKFLEKVLDESWEKVGEIKGKDLVGLHYEGPFDFLPKVKEIAEKNPEKFHLVVEAEELVIATKGTGILHMAPGCGEEDFKLGKELGLPILNLIDDEANYLEGMGEFSRKNAKFRPELIIDFLKNYEGGKFLLKTAPFTHRYPVCWRCKTELVWKVADEWYIAMDKPGKDGRTLRERMKSVAKKIRWIPEFGLERELDWLSHMKDWLISKKNRYWGLSLPIWECKKCGHFEVIGGKEELKEKAVEGWDKFEGHSPHKPYIDFVKIKCPKCGGLMERVGDVGNPWLDAGIVPFSTIKKDNKGEPLYLTNRKEWEKWFPADFITESFPGQFKNWFYALIAMSTVLEDRNPYKTVLGFGTLLGEDGRPMHKSWGNAIEFNEGAERIGADVMRWMYVRSNPAENLLFGYKRADEVKRLFYFKLWNIYVYFVTYVLLDEIDERDYKKLDYEKLEPIDKWILNRLLEVTSTVEDRLKDYDPQRAALSIEAFVEDISNWYIRLSRNRVWVNSENREDKIKFYSTLYYLLVNLSIILSPFLPFITEEMYKNLTSKESVHLADWPELKEIKKAPELISKFGKVKEVLEAGRRERKEKGIKLRQPLPKALISVERPLDIQDFLFVIKNELNVKEIEVKKAKEGVKVVFDTNLTEELKLEGEFRELIRRIQVERKKQNLAPKDRIKVIVPERFRSFESELKRKVLAEKVEFSKDDKISVEIP